MAATGLLGFNPYRKGVEFDPSSKSTALYVNLQQREKQREQARQDALDKYFMEYDKNINPAGMRTQDIDGLLKEQQKSKAFYYQNKNLIQNPAKDNGAAYTKWVSMNQQMLGKISQSKKAAADGLVINKAIMDAKKNGMVVDDATMTSIIKSQAPIWDNDYNPFDASRFNAYKPFDPAAFVKETYQDGKKFTTKRIEPQTAGDRYKDVIVTELDPAQIPKLEETVKTRLQNGLRTKTDGFAYHVLGVMNDKEELSKVNEIFKKYYKRNVNDLNDIAVGVALQYAPYNREEKMRGLTTDASINMAIAKSQATTNRRQEQEAEIDNVISEIYLSSPSVNQNVLEGIKEFMPTVYGLKNVTNSIPEKVRKRFEGMDYVLQDQDFNLYSFDFTNGRIRNIEGKDNQVSVVPAKTYRLDFSQGLTGQKGAKAEINKTPTPNKPNTPSTPPQTTFGSGTRPRG